MKRNWTPDILSTLLCFVVIPIGLLMATSPLCGCGSRKLRVVEAFDTSLSMKPEKRKWGSGIIHSAHDSVFSSGTHTEIWTFAKATQKHYEGFPERGVDLWPTMDEIIPLQTSGRGTHPEVMLKEFSRALETAKNEGEALVCILVWDGDMSDPAALKRAAKELSEHKNLLALWVIGVEAEQGLRNAAERTLSPLDPKVIVSGSHDAKDGLARFRALVETR